jgi:hypothetical protein
VVTGMKPFDPFLANLFHYAGTIKKPSPVMERLFSMGKSMRVTIKKHRKLYYIYDSAVEKILKFIQTFQ